MYTIGLRESSNLRGLLAGPDHSQRAQVVKAINKVAVNTILQAEGRYGKPLGNNIHNTQPV
ncbi:hypothetical protein hamaS1_22360 [Moorella sp. Hama-1]|nr:hypothetical protein hamaS1_22360 [Moorella sp. Hama-1]